MLCLVVEYETAESDFPPFTQAHPGATVEIMAEPATQNGEEDARTALVLIRGAPAPAVQGLISQLAKTSAPVQTLRNDPTTGMWFGRATFHPRHFHSPSNQAIVAVLGLVGPPWVHIEHGVVHLRARIKDPEHADDIVDLAHGTLQHAGVDAQVVAQEVSPKDHSVWETLVQHGIGLNP